MMFQVIVQTVHKINEWKASFGLPTFFLDGDVQGIVDCTHAVKIALKIVDPNGLAIDNGVTFNIHVSSQSGESAHFNTELLSTICPVCAALPGAPCIRVSDPCSKRYLEEAPVGVVHRERGQHV